MRPEKKIQESQPCTNAVTDAYGRLVRVYERLLHDLTDGIHSSPHLNEFADLLATVPLSTDDFGLAAKRLTNVRMYVSQGEIGPARYELSMLLRNLVKRWQMDE
jgi:hypothetical protein